MLKRFRSSRGWKKLTKSKLAVVSMWIIGAYLALSLWIVAVECVNAVGVSTGVFNLSRHPVLGLFLADQVGERVGARWLPGLTSDPAKQSIARREDQADFLVKQAEKGIQAALRSSENPQDGLAQAALAQRELAHVPLSKLQDRLKDAQDRFARMDGIKKQQSLLTKVQTQAQSASAIVKTVQPESVDAKTAREQLATQIEEVMFALEDYQKVALAGDPLKALKLDDLQENADMLRDGKGELALTASTRTILESIATQSAGSLKGIEGQLSPMLAEVEQSVGKLYPMPTGFAGAVYKFRLLLGTDAGGRSIMVRSLYSAKIAIQVGMVVAFISVILGAFIGAAAAYFGGWVEHLTTWVYSTLSSLPQLVLLAVLAFMFLGSSVERTLIPVYVALCLTFWIGPCRVIRGEVLKIKELEYAQAAKVIGFSRLHILLRHVMPNTLHLMFINFSLLFIAAIKTEVVLTFLGLGIKEGVSWGLMITQSSSEVVSGLFWQISAATFFMFVLVLAFNVFSDALQDAFDPKHVG